MSSSSVTKDCSVKFDYGAEFPNRFNNSHKKCKEEAMGDDSNSGSYPGAKKNNERFASCIKLPL